MSQDDYWLFFFILLVSMSNLIYSVTNKFWLKNSLHEIASNKVFSIPLKIYGLINLIGGLIAMAIILVNLNNIIEKYTQDTKQIEVPILFSIIGLSLVYPLINKFWISKPINNDLLVPVRFFRINESISLPIQRTKLLLISLFFLAFLHITFFNEIKYYNVVMDQELNSSKSGYSESEYNNFIKDKTYAIQYTKEKYSGIFPENYITIIYFGYLAIFSAFILSARFKAIERKV